MVSTTPAGTHAPKMGQLLRSVWRRHLGRAGILLGLRVGGGARVGRIAPPRRPPSLPANGPARVHDPGEGPTRERGCSRKEKEMTLREREHKEAARTARMAAATQVVARRRGLDPASLNSATQPGWREALYLSEWWGAVARLKETVGRFHKGPYGTDPPTPFGTGEKMVVKARVGETRRILARLREARVSN